MPTEAQAVASVIAGQLGFGRRGICVPHYTPADWYECDVAHITDSGYLVEYEVKLTRADFRRDREKRPRLSVRQRRQQAAGLEVQLPPSKHQELERGNRSGPCRFWYVAPAGLIPPDELPEWAGLLELVEEGSGHYYRLQQAKKPRQLHREQVRQDVAQHMRGVCYYRMLNYMMKAGERKRDEPIQCERCAGRGQ